MSIAQYIEKDERTKHSKEEKKITQQNMKYKIKKMTTTTTMNYYECHSSNMNTNSTETYWRQNHN